MTGAGIGWVDPEDFVVSHVAERDRAFWLDGSGARPWSGRMSYVGWLEDDDTSVTQDAASRVVTLHAPGGSRAAPGDVFQVLDGFDSGAVVPRPAGWVGYFGYAARPDLPARLDRAPGAIDSCWLRVSRWVAFDHARRTVHAVAPPEELPGWRERVGRLVACVRDCGSPPAAGPARVVDTCGRSAFDEAFGVVQSELRVGNSYEVNLTFRTTVESADAPLDTYRRLRRLSPAPYAAFITHRGTTLLSSSPERFAAVDRERVIETRPIKGTTARESDPVLDAAAAARLRAEPKFLGENLMIVDLLRNDMSRVCEVGTVTVTDLMHVESYPRVHQLSTTIAGRLRADVSTVRALSALFPGGSMTGAPKLRTMQIIRDVESTPRGVYSGAMGWMRDDGRADLGIVIRSLVHRDGRYVLGTGGGITVRSVVDEEYAEANWKADNLLRSLGIE